MSGKPAARMTDSTLKGGPIIQGSFTVLIGTQVGVACSECPGGVRVGSPVNPSLGAKFLDGGLDTDFAMPGPLSLTWQRQYSSYVNLKEGARCGLHGYGWSSPVDIEIEHRTGEVKIFDSRGRTITFDEKLQPGATMYSASENLWLARGGGSKLSSQLGISLSDTSGGGSEHWSATSRFAHLARNRPLWVQNPNLLFATSGDADAPVWCFASLQATLDGSVGKEDVGYPDHRETTSSLGRCHLHRVIDRFGREKVLGRDESGRLASIQDPLGRTFEFVYRQLYDAKPTSGAWLADSGIRLSYVVMSYSRGAPNGGEAITESELGKDSANRFILARYHYSEAGDLIQVDRRDGVGARRFKYRNHLMIGHCELSDDAMDLDALKGVAAQQEGFAHQYNYDRYEPGARVIEQHNRDGLSYRFDYVYSGTAEGSRTHTHTVVSDSLGRRETYRFEGDDGLKRVVEHTRADGGAIKYSYDGAGRKIAEIDPIGRVTRYALSPDGNLLSAQGMSGVTSTFMYDKAGRLISRSTDAGGKTASPIVMTLSYDTHGRLVQTTMDGQVVEQRRYAENLTPGGSQTDRPIEVVDANGGVKHLAWDVADQLTSYTDCSGRTTFYRFSGYGETTRVVDSADRTTEYKFDKRGRLARVIYADDSSETLHYDSGNRLIATVPFTAPSTTESHGARAGESVSVRRDRVGRVVERILAGASKNFDYDIAGRLVRLTNENESVARFEYDLMDRLTKEEGFDGRTQSYEYNAAGELVRSKDGADSSEELNQQFEYDQAGRLIVRTLQRSSDGKDTLTFHFEHNQAGLIINAKSFSIDDPALGQQIVASTDWKRDRYGRVVEESQRLYRCQERLGEEKNAPEVEFEHTIAHRYDALGNRVETDLSSLPGAWITA
jgi:YD repeat-containing protein